MNERPPTYVVFHSRVASVWRPTLVLRFTTREKAERYLLEYPEDYIVPESEYDKVAICWALNVIHNRDLRALPAGFNAALGGRIVLPWPEKPIMRERTGP